MSEQLTFDLEYLSAQTDKPRRSFSPIHSRLWTENKARLISEYLRYFVYITKHGVYIDGFAGPQYSDQSASWAAKLVLANEPKWLRKFYLCDNDPRQYALLESLRISQPEVRNRVVHVKQVDFNSYVGVLLEESGIRETTATFCLLDQRTFECDWGTVKKIASHKCETKIEIFYFIPTGWLGRSISALSSPETRMLRWWGRCDWPTLVTLRGTEVAQGCRERFLHELEYRYADLWPIYESHFGKRIMYYMLHASDHDEAPRQMHRAYKNITRRSIPIEPFETQRLPMFD